VGPSKVFAPIGTFAAPDLAQVKIKCLSNSWLTAQIEAALLAASLRPAVPDRDRIGHSQPRLATRRYWKATINPTPKASTAPRAISGIGKRTGFGPVGMMLRARYSPRSGRVGVIALAVEPQ
jgi:hypothetical protein